MLHKLFLWNEAQSRMDAYCRYPWRWRTHGVATDEFGNAFAPKFRIASNEFLTEFAFKSERYRRGLLSETV